MKTLGQIAEYLDGELRGNADVAITRVVHPALVRGPEDLALVLSRNVLELLKQNQVTNAVVSPAVSSPSISPASTASSSTTTPLSSVQSALAEVLARLLGTGSGGSPDSAALCRRA